MPWHLEIYDLEGKRLSVADGVSYKEVVEAAKDCQSGHFGEVRFRGPAEATIEQLERLIALGAQPTE